jgi:hypothetical protein
MSRGAAPALLAALLLTIGPAAARAAESQVWLEPGVRYEATKKLSLAFDQHLRFSLDPAQLASAMPDVSVAYDLLGWLRARAGYRFIYERNRFDRFVVRHRIFGDLRARAKWQKIRVADRVRYQEQVTSEVAQEARHTLRNQVALGYDTDRWIEPVASAEVFYRFGGRFGTGVHKYRFEVGAVGDAADHELTLTYKFEKPIADDNDPSLHIVALSYNFTP